VSVASALESARCAVDCKVNRRARPRNVGCFGESSTAGVVALRRLRYTIDVVHKARGTPRHAVSTANGRLAWDDAVAQVAGDARRTAHWCARLTNAGESDDSVERLWAAVLRDAIEALRGWHLDSRGGQAVAQSAAVLWQEARAWMHDDADGPVGTFVSLCAVLALDVDVVRRDLTALADVTARVPARPPPVAPRRRDRAYRAA